MEFPAILKQLRRQKGLSQRDLAKLLNLHYSTIGMYETGKREPDFEILQKIANYFGVTTDLLLGRNFNQSDNKPVKDKIDLREGLSEEEQRQLESFREFLISQRKGGEGRNEQAATMGK